MTPAIIVDDLTYSYPDQSQSAIDHVSLTIPQGHWTVLVGKNGSGKSTLAQLIAGLRQPVSGKISFANYYRGKKANGDDPQIGYLFQDPDNQFVGPTVADDVAFGLENLAIAPSVMRQRVKESLAGVGMSDYLNYRPDNLSGGQKQRVALAGVLAMHPQIIILDEATSMIDPAGRQSLTKLIRQQQVVDGLTVLSITHDDAEMEFAEDVLVMSGGRLLAQGPPAEIVPQFDFIPRPAGERFRQALEQHGARVPQSYMTTKEMGRWLNKQFNSHTSA